MNAEDARREYNRAYRQKNAEKINQKLREWRRANPDKVREANKRHWERRAKRLDAEKGAESGQ
ncbi:hypothetical protein R80B4_00052 [Fibrobacteres bacterium R8-0-B4]